MRTSSSLLILLCFAAPALSQSLVDPTLRLRTYVSGLDLPTGAAFLDGNGTALITEKDTGKVKLVQNQQVISTVLDLPVSTDSERGLLSITLSPSFASDRFVYLYHTAARADGGDAITNKISRYRWTGTSLEFDRKIIDLPGGPGPNHDGGKVAFDSKGKLYAVIGDLNRNERTTNDSGSSDTNRVACVIRINPYGRAIATNPFNTGGSRSAASDIFAYGIRNSFGLAVDPVTGDLWDTENGPDRFDEVNRITPGFNGGWESIQGPLSRVSGDPGALVSLGSRANYQDPKLSFVAPVAPTDIEFVQSAILGDDYRNDMLMGDTKTGSLYHFDLTSNRKSLQLTGVLSDRVADNTGADRLLESDQLILGSGFGIVSDIINGPGGMYVLSLLQGTMYRINKPADANRIGVMQPVPEPATGLLALAVFSLVLRQSDKAAATR